MRQPYFIVKMLGFSLCLVLSDALIDIDALAREVSAVGHRLANHRRSYSILTQG